MLLKIFCEICGEHIANANAVDLKLPLTGAMFLSTNSERKIPPPFHPDLDWIHMRCPYGPHRPFIHDNRIMTDRGFVPIKGTLVVPGTAFVDGNVPVEINDSMERGFVQTKGTLTLPPEEDPPIWKELIQPFICPYCNRSDFKSKAGYKAHVRACAKKEEE